MRKFSFIRPESRYSRGRRIILLITLSSLSFGLCFCMSKKQRVKAKAESVTKIARKVKGAPGKFREIFEEEVRAIKGEEERELKKKEQFEAAIGMLKWRRRAKRREEEPEAERGQREKNIASAAKIDDAPIEVIPKTGVKEEGALKEGAKEAEAPEKEEAPPKTEEETKEVRKKEFETRKKEIDEQQKALEDLRGKETKEADDEVKIKKLEGELVSLRKEQVEAVRSEHEGAIKEAEDEARKFEEAAAKLFKGEELGEDASQKLKDMKGRIDPKREELVKVLEKVTKAKEAVDLSVNYPRSQRRMLREELRTAEKDRDIINESIKSLGAPFLKDLTNLDSKAAEARREQATGILKAAGLSDEQAMKFVEAGKRLQELTRDLEAAEEKVKAANKVFDDLTERDEKEKAKEEMNKVQAEMEVIDKKVKAAKNSFDEIKEPIAKILEETGIKEETLFDAIPPTKEAQTQREAVFLKKYEKAILIGAPLASLGALALAGAGAVGGGALIISAATSGDEEEEIIFEEEPGEEKEGEAVEGETEKEETKEVAVLAPEPYKFEEYDFDAFYENFTGE